jgi:hypothetical protein
MSGSEFVSVSSDSESEWNSEEDCEWEWDIPQQGNFAPGKNIGMMTYREMYDTVIKWHTKAAGEQLCVHCRLPYSTIKQTFAASRTENGDTQTLLKNMGRQKDITMSILCENIGISTEASQVFETYIKDFGESDLTDLDMVDGDYDGTDCCRKRVRVRRSCRVSLDFGYCF